MRAKKSVHPLLLEPTYWRNRLQGLDLSRSYPLITPRPDLSPPGTEVVEFRLKSYDGRPLSGLFARPTWQRGPWPARIRAVCGPKELQPEDLEVDKEAVRSGTAEFIFREQDGRRLEDRVLDVVQVCHLAYRTQGIDEEAVSFSCPGAERAPDEFLIAEQLFAGRFV